MTYYKSFNCNPHYPREDMRVWLVENEVQIHSIKDAGMYGNINVRYSSPKLTDGRVKIAGGYESLHGFSRVSFSSDDATA
jgi:hypothetical protein